MLLKTAISDLRDDSLICDRPLASWLSYTPFPCHQRSAMVLNAENWLYIPVRKVEVPCVHSRPGRSLQPHRLTKTSAAIPVRLKNSVSNGKEDSPDRKL